MRSILSLCVALTLSAVLCGTGSAQETVFSGPQVGEALPPLSLRNIVGPQAGRESNPVAAAEGRPLLLIFVHQRERPAFGLANALTKAAALRHSHGLQRQIVFLTDDPTSTEAWLRQIARYFEKQTPVGISMEGGEGPGAYGLNRNVTMTVLVGREGKVTANFALVQPSLPADGPKILQAIWDATGGGEVPAIATFAPQGMRERMRADAGDRQDEQLRRLLRAFIQKDASTEQVEKAATAIEDYVTDNRTARHQLGQIARRVVASPKFSGYATPAARDKLKSWADRYGQKGQKKAPSAPQADPAGESASEPSPQEGKK